MTSPRCFALTAAPGERFTISRLTIGVKFETRGTPFCTSCDAGVDVLAPVANTFFGFGLKAISHSTSQSTITQRLQVACLCGSLAQCAMSLKRLSAGPWFNPQARQNKLFQDYWRACFEINFSDRQEGLTVSSIICDR